MFKLDNKLLVVFLSALLFCVSGCSPFHKVYGTDVLKVYEVSEVNNNKYGKYKYSITDGTGRGWQLITNSKFEVGDHLEIVKKSPVAKKDLH